jgi:hypothetical protein
MSAEEVEECSDVVSLKGFRS